MQWTLLYKGHAWLSKRLMGHGVNAAVHWAQRTASEGICERQYGQSFTAGAAAAARTPFHRLIGLMSQNITTVTMRKLMTSFTETP